MFYDLDRPMISSPNIAKTSHRAVFVGVVEIDTHRHMTAFSAMNIRP